MIYIVIPVFNRWEDTRNCLKCLERQSYKQFKTIVVDHGSSDGTSENILKDFPEVILIKGDNSLWWTGATNLGVVKALELSKFELDYILTLNNDLVVNSDYLNNLLRVSYNNMDSLIGSICVDIDSPQMVYFAGTKWNRITAKYKTSIDISQPLNIIQNNNLTIESDLLPGRGVLIPKKCFLSLGLYDEKRFPHYMADEEFSWRCKKHGFSLLVSPNSVVYSSPVKTGIRQSNNVIKDYTYWKNLFTSNKSPNSFVNRWRWAKCCSSIPLLYFCLDFFRITYSRIRA